MGIQKDYVDEGGFTQYLYAHSEVIREDGLEVKVIYVERTKDYHESLPLYSNTSQMYFGIKCNRTGRKEIDQLRFYKDRKASFDFDWGHDHYVKENGKVVKTYPEGVVHVQFYKIVDGRPVRDGRVRYMNNAEIKKYGKLLKKANSGVKFRTRMG